MTTLFQAIIDWLHLLWPLRIVEQWENGVYYVCGKSWKTVGPGLYPLFPWFMDLRTVTVAPRPLQTERIEITLSDDSIVSFAVTASVKVVDAAAALNNIDNYHEATLLIIAAELTDHIARVNLSRLDAARRPRLARDLARWVTKETSKFGVNVSRVRFTSFIRKARVFRLIGDGAATNTEW